MKQSGLPLLGLLFLVYSCKKHESIIPPNTAVPLKAISFSKDTINVTIGTQVIFTVSLTPSNTTDTALTFTSANTSVATVTKPGTISGLTIGSTYITASNKAGNVTAKCIVNVTPIATTSITLNKDSSTILIGNTDTLKATILPSNATYSAVTWASANTAIATVNSAGVITSVARGVTTVTATTQDGKEKASCVVVVANINDLIWGKPNLNFETVRQQQGEAAGCYLYNNTKYPVTVTSWKLLSLTNTTLSQTSGNPLATVNPASGYYTAQIFESFAANNLADNPSQFYYFPMLMYFTCQNKNYQLAITYFTSQSGTTSYISTITPL